MTTLKVGDPAPAFSGKDQNGNEVNLDQFKGSKLLLYFYPKDNTPGCTAEACNIRDNYREYIGKGYKVLGVSADSETSHQKFIEKYSLPFPLLSDPDKVVLKAYGAWGEKKLYGRSYEGVLRKSFVISETGIIEKIIDKVKTNDHTRQIF